MGFCLSPVHGLYCQAQRLANMFTEYLRFAGILREQILAALDRNVRAPVVVRGLHAARGLDAARAICEAVLRNRMRIK
jgi:hypothetical protein